MVARGIEAELHDSLGQPGRGDYRLTGAGAYDPGMEPSGEWSGLPGADLVHLGIDDLRAGRETESSLLVAVAAERLRAIGVELPDVERIDFAWHRLYDLLNAADPRAAHSRYNALLGRMASFARAAEHARAS